MNLKKSSRQTVGKLGENIAEKYLISRKWKIVCRNYHCRYGEIDIIAFDYSRNKELVFVEVKTRMNESFGEPQESVDFFKRTKILKTALYFLNSASELSFSSWRADVVAVKLNAGGKIKSIKHFKNIFNGT